jgi:hypothetical protein
MIMHYCTAEIHLYEPGFSTATPFTTIHPRPSSPPAQFASTAHLDMPSTRRPGTLSSLSSSTPAANLARNELLSACLYTISRYFAAIISIPPAHYYIFTVSIYGGMLHVVATMFKIFILKFDDWDLRYARAVLDPSIVIGTMAKQMEEARRIFEGKSIAANGGLALGMGLCGNADGGAAPSGKMSCWALNARKVRWLAQCYEMRIGAELAAADAGANTHAGTAANGNLNATAGSQSHLVSPSGDKDGNRAVASFSLGDILQGRGQTKAQAQAQAQAQAIAQLQAQNGGGIGLGMGAGMAMAMGMGVGDEAGMGGMADNFDLVDEALWGDIMGDWDFMKQ